MAKSRLKSALSFSHLIGGASAGRNARRAEDDDQENNAPPGADDGDEDDGNTTPSGRSRPRGDDDDTNPDDDNTTPSGRSRARGDDDDTNPGDDNTTPSGRGRARGDDDADAEGDEEDEEDNDDPNARASRARERARCAAIFATKAAADRPDLAAHLAFNTSLPRSEAKGLLKAAAKGASRRGGALADAMAQFGQQRVSASAPSVSRQTSIDAGWDAAAKRAGVIRK